MCMCACKGACVDPLKMHTQSPAAYYLGTFHRCMMSSVPAAKSFYLQQVMVALCLAFHCESCNLLGTPILPDIQTAYLQLGLFSKGLLTSFAVVCFYKVVDCRLIDRSIFSLSAYAAVWILTIPSYHFLLIVKGAKVFCGKPSFPSQFCMAIIV